MAYDSQTNYLIMSTPLLTGVFSLSLLSIFGYSCRQKNKKKPPQASALLADQPSSTKKVRESISLKGVVSQPHNARANNGHKPGQAVEVSARRNAKGGKKKGEVSRMSLKHSQGENQAKSESQCRRPNEKHKPKQKKCNGTKKKESMKELSPSSIFYNNHGSTSRTSSRIYTNTVPKSKDANSKSQQSGSKPVNNKRTTNSSKSVTLIATDCTREDAVVEIVKSLQVLQSLANDIFQTANRRLTECKGRLKIFNGRLDTLDKKVESLKESSEPPVLCSLGKYPEIADGTAKVVFSNVPSLTPYYAHSAGDIFNSNQSKSEFNAHAVKGSYMRKRDFKYVFDTKPKFLEAVSLVEVNSTCIDLEASMEEAMHFEVDEESKFHARKYISEPVKASIASVTSESLLVHCDFGSGDATLDPFSYKPELADLSNFDFPDVLPHLPGTSKSIALNDIFFPSIAPSSIQLDYIINQPDSITAFDVDLTARNSFYMPESSEDKILESLSLKETSLEKSSMDLSFTSVERRTSEDVEAKSLGLSLCTDSLKTTTLQDSAQIVATSQLKESSVPPAPPPPPPPLISISTNVLSADSSSKGNIPDLTKSHSDLMESIRAAGGMKMLKKVDRSPASSDSGSATSKRASTKPSVAQDSGDDLMTSLAKALEKRRKGISGKDSTMKKLDQLETKGNKTLSEKTEPFSRLRQIIPPPNQSATKEDEDNADDWIS
ncbi:WAHD domain of WASH complex domain-containing protein [Ditylenchus destructor]|nr:WAHD domain of WASH complex domain-containing protein [Ditylenchus destructor]